MMSAVQKSKNKSFYHQRRKKGSFLNVNLRGFLCSCNSREKDCIKEAYNLLTKYADKLWPHEDPVSQEACVEDALKQEVAELKSSANKANRFQVVDSGAKNLVFITATVEDPVRLAYEIVSDIHMTNIQQTRFLIRLVPIEVICTSSIKNIENAFTPLAIKYFKNNPKTFAITYNYRKNDNLKREEVIKTLADIVFNVRSDNKVDLKAAEVTIVVEVIKGLVLIGVVPEFIKYKKYNLLSVGSKENEEEVKADDL